MNKRPFKSSILLLTAAFLLVFTACQKEEKATPNADQATVEQAKQAMANQQIMLSSFNIAQWGAENANGYTGDKVDERSCGNITVTPPDLLVFPKLITADYGAGCTDDDGKFKQGKVNMTVGAFWEPNASIIVTYDNFYEDNVKLEGQFVFVNLSTPDAAILRIDAQNIKLTDQNGETFSFSGDQTYTQTAGHASWWDENDDVYEVTGSIFSTLTNGETVNWLIQTPLVKANNCDWVSQGKGTLEINGLPVYVDYGDGSCDDQGTYTVNGQVFPFTI
ncbi:MAG: hypothetical protein MUC59_09225 [Saprospiraceae bacterium]|jgi:hypothetical protein|nr:hypothetical protein [Saprospiraceae bacterium]